MRAGGHQAPGRVIPGQPPGFRAYFAAAAGFLAAFWAALRLSDV